MAEYIAHTHTANGQNVLALIGDWQVETLVDVEMETDTLLRGAGPDGWLIDASRLSSLDTAGAWLLDKLMHRIGAKDIYGLKREHEAMVELVIRAHRDPF